MDLPEPSVHERWRRCPCSIDRTPAKCHGANVVLDRPRAEGVITTGRLQGPTSKLWLIVTVIFCSCTQGDEAQPGDGQSTTSGAGEASTSTVTTLPPSRPIPYPYDLPEYCQDGVSEPGQYDCFVPVPIGWINDVWSHQVPKSTSFDYYGVDLNDDGSEEIVVHHQSGALALLVWNGTNFDFDDSVPNEDTTFGQYGVDDQWDWTGDGRADLTLSSSDGIIRFRESTSRTMLGVERIAHQPDFKSPKIDPSGPWWFHGAVAVDVDADGLPEVLGSQVVGNYAGQNPVEELVLHRRIVDQWEAVGDRIPYGPCGWLIEVAYGDFDNDGDEDLAILDELQSCDPFPSAYDPEWYRVLVLLTDAAQGTVEVGGYYSLGATADLARIWAEDIDQDGNTDLIARVRQVRTSGQVDHGLTVLHGRGDGSFSGGSPIEFGSKLRSYYVDVRADLDGDGREEWLVTRSDDGPLALASDLEVSEEAIKLAVPINPSDGAITEVLNRGRAVADVNGDGIDDYLVSSHHPSVVHPREGLHWMVSAP